MEWDAEPMKTRLAYHVSLPIPEGIYNWLRAVLVSEVTQGKSLVCLLYLAYVTGN